MASTEEPTPGAAPTTVEESVEQVIRERLSELLGGWYGSLETALPTIAFVVLWVWRSDVQFAVLGAIIATVLLVGIRLARGGSLRYVLSSLIGIGLAAFFALRSGNAEDAFLPGILISAGYGVAALVSIVTRWPMIGFLVAVADPDYAQHPTKWRQSSGLVRVCSRLTWVLVGLFAVRVAIMLPLYLAGEVAWLGFTKIALGWPAYIVAIVIMGVLLSVGRTPVEEPESI